MSFAEHLKKEEQINSILSRTKYMDSFFNPQNGLPKFGGLPKNTSFPHGGGLPVQNMRPQVKEIIETKTETEELEDNVKDMSNELDNLDKIEPQAEATFQKIQTNKDMDEKQKDKLLKEAKRNKDLKWDKTNKRLDGIAKKIKTVNEKSLKSEAKKIKKITTKSDNGNNVQEEEKYPESPKVASNVMKIINRLPDKKKKEILELMD